MHPAVLILADGRFPTGGHVHSAGVEAACALGDIHDVDSLETFVHGRIATQGRVDASVAAWVCRAGTEAAATKGAMPWAVVDAEVEARIASPALRRASRTQGRQLLRAARRIWDLDSLEEVSAVHPDGVFQPLALGAVAAGVGLSPEDAARVTLHHLVAGLVTAAVRLLGLDPFAIAALQTRIAASTEPILADVITGLPDDPCDLPATTSLLADVYAEHHTTWEVRLFAS